MRKKFDSERDRLVELNNKKKDMKGQEADSRLKETRMMEIAKEKHNIDFQDPEQIAERGKEEAYREQYN